MCPKAKPSRTCHVVKVNFEALKAAKMRFLLSTNWPVDSSHEQVATLKKTTEEGLDLVLNDHQEGATATVSYRVIIKL